jgi:hypothetical protein
MIGNGMLSVTIHVATKHFQLPTTLVTKIYRLLYAWWPKGFHNQSCGDWMFFSHYKIDDWNFFGRHMVSDKKLSIIASLVTKCFGHHTVYIDWNEFSSNTHKPTLGNPRVPLT